MLQHHVDDSLPADLPGLNIAFYVGFVALGLLHVGCASCDACSSFHPPDPS